MSQTPEVEKGKSERSSFAVNIVAETALAKTETGGEHPLVGALKEAMYYNTSKEPIGPKEVTELLKRAQKVSVRAAGEVVTSTVLPDGEQLLVAQQPTHKGGSSQHFRIEPGDILVLSRTGRSKGTYQLLQLAPPSVRQKSPLYQARTIDFRDRPHKTPDGKVQLVLHPQLPENMMGRQGELSPEVIFIENTTRAPAVEKDGTIYEWTVGEVSLFKPYSRKEALLPFWENIAEADVDQIAEVKTGSGKLNKIPIIDIKISETEYAFDKFEENLSIPEHVLAEAIQMLMKKQSEEILDEKSSPLPLYRLEAAPLEFWKSIYEALFQRSKLQEFKAKRFTLVIGLFTGTYKGIKINLNVKMEQLVQLAQRFINFYEGFKARRQQYLSKDTRRVLTYLQNKAREKAAPKTVPERDKPEIEQHIIGLNKGSTLFKYIVT